MLICFAGVPLGAQTLDRILAVVSGNLVLQSDAVAAIRLGLVDVGAASDRTQAALDKLIERRLMLIEVDRYGPQEPVQSEIDAGMAAMTSRIAAGDSLEAILRDTGYAMEQLRAFVRDDVRIRTYLQQRFGAAQDPVLLRDWLAGLRRRADVNVLYLPVR